MGSLTVTIRMIRFRNSDDSISAVGTKATNNKIKPQYSTILTSEFKNKHTLELECNYTPIPARKSNDEI